MIASSARDLTIAKLDLRGLVSSIATEDFNPDLAPALRQVAQRAEELAEQCEGGTCPRAAEEAPEGEETRAAEEALEAEPVTVEVIEEIDDRFNVTLSIDLRNMSVTTSVPEEVEDEPEVDDMAERKRLLVARYQDGQTALARSLIE